MEPDQFVGTWVMIIYDEAAKPQPWKDCIPIGSSFQIAKDSYDYYWYLPSPQLKAPMNQPKKLFRSDEEHGSFDVGELLPGTLYGDFGGKVGRLFFAINQIRGTTRVVSLSQSHGGSHGVEV